MRGDEGRSARRRARSILYSGRFKALLACLLVIFLCAAEASAQVVGGLSTVRVASGLNQPVFVTAPPGDFTRLFIVQKTGQILILNLATLASDPDPKNALNATPFLDLSSKVSTASEQGLLGLAFDPNYSANGKFYVYFVVPGGSFNSGVIHVSQFHVSSTNADIADPTETILRTSQGALFTVDHPQGNHDGGWIGFSTRGPNDDHNLYIASGDGGNGDDTGTGHHEPGGNAQYTQTFLGKMLRIHVDPTTAIYTIPANNPFANSTGPEFKEIWLLGLRNPYRDSFDRLTGRMFIGDVGQATREEVDVQQPTNPGGGENYGWRDREGTIQNPAYPTATPTPTPVPPRVEPILDYPRAAPVPPCGGIAGRTVIGGYVYRGKQIPALKGTYVFGDYLGPNNCSAKIFTLNYDGATVSNVQEATASLFPTSDSSHTALTSPSGFGEDANGEIYITDIGNNSVYRITPVTANVQIDHVAKDTQTGHIMVHGFGLPFKTHTIKGTNDLTQSFNTVGSVMAGGDGGFQFDASNLGARFYRVTFP